MPGPIIELPRVDFIRDVDDFDGAFAPPVVPTPSLPPVTIPGYRPTPPPTATPPSIPAPNVPAAPNVLQRIGTGIWGLASRLMILLTPMNSGPEGTGNLFGGPGALYPDGPPSPPPPPPPDPDPVPELETVYIRPPPRPPGRSSVGNDPIMPPNWSDLANPGDRIFFDTVGRRPVTDWWRVPIPDLGDRPAPEPLGDFGGLPLPGGPDVFPDVELEPEYVTVPAPLPTAPTIFPDAFGLPDPYEFGSPRPGTGQIPRPGTGIDTGDGPQTPRTPTAPITPLLPVPTNVRPPLRPGGVDLPDFFTSPVPDPQDYPEPGEFLDTPDSTDACQCDKAPKKKKKKKKERDICRQGTYTQRAKGIKYAPRRIVPCEGEIEPEPKKASSSRKRSKTRRPRPGQFPSFELITL